MKISALLPLALGGLLIVGNVQCDRHRPTAPRALTTGALLVEAKAVDETPEAAAKVPTAQGRLRVSGEGMAARDTLLTVQGGRLRARLDGIPVGLRQVGLFLLASSGDTLWGGTGDVTVQANAVATAIIPLERHGDQPPKADFNVSPELGGLRHTFRLQAQVDDVHDPTDSLQVRWDFENDGRFEIDWTTIKDTAHVFGDTGNYRIALEVRDRSNKTSSLTKQVQVIDPKAKLPDTLRVIPTGNLVTLDGRQSTGIAGQPLIFHWSQVLDQLQAKQVSVMGTFTDNNSATAGLVSFEPRAGRGLYLFTLVVEVAGVQSEPATAHVFVVSARPMAQVEVPATLRTGESLQLQGQAVDADDTVLQYRWRGERVGLLSDSTSASPVFTPDQEGVYSFQLVAIDADPQESEPAEVAITVRPANRPPLADAGPDQEVEVGAEVVLDGSGSRDADGDSLSYTWTAPEGVGLNSATALQPRFTATAAGTYPFSLVVNDSLVDSPADTVLVRVNEPVVAPPPNRVPAADAGLDQEVEVGVGVVLDGSGSRDADGDSLGYSWRSLDGAVLDDASAIRPRFSAESAGAFRFELVVSDEQASSQPDTVVVQINEPVVVPPPNTPLVADAGPDQEVEVGVEVALDGSGSRDADGDSLGYSWRSLDGAVLDDASAIRPRFSAESAGAFRFELVVSDEQASSQPDTVVVGVLSMPKLVFSSNRDGDFEIYSVNVDGSDLVQLTENETDDQRPKVAPDGLSIVFSSFRDGGTDQWTNREGADIYWMTSEGTGQVNLTQSTNHDDEPALSSSNRLAFSSTSGIDALGNVLVDIWVMDLDGNNLSNLTESTGRNTQPSWSPDGSRIAFTSLSQGEALKDIYVMNADGSGLVNLTNTPEVEEEEPAWSPDGASIAFVSNQNGDADIYLMNADGSGLVNLTQGSGDFPGDEYSPSWSPDGRSIAYVSLNGPESDIYVMNADGSDPRAVVEDAQDPAWLPGE